MEPVVHLRAAVALLGRFPALAGVDLTVDHGEIVLLQGSNGAGKTSLLRLCAGLLPLAEGTGVVLGHDLGEDRVAVRRRVGYLAHATGLYDELTVVDNVRFWTRAAGADLADADVAMERLGLVGRLRDAPVSKLSMGQRRRTSLASMLARRPELWLLDEPHAGLDADARDLVDSLVRAAAASGATVLVASHEHERALALAERIVTIGGGVVTADTGGATAAPSGVDPHRFPNKIDAISPNEATERAPSSEDDSDVA